MELVHEVDEDTTGPAAHVAVDPDGNPILVDLHVRRVLKPEARAVDTRHDLAILDDDPDRTAAMKAALGSALPDVETIFFDNAPDMIRWLDDGLSGVRLLSLDHDLGPTRDRNGDRFDPGIGRDVVDVLETRAPSCPVIIHSSNGPAADGMLYALRLSGWSAERVYPHGDLTWVEADWIDRIAAYLGTD